MLSHQPQLRNTKSKPLCGPSWPRSGCTLAWWWTAVRPAARRIRQPPRFAHKLRQHTTGYMELEEFSLFSFRDVLLVYHGTDTVYHHINSHQSFEKNKQTSTMNSQQVAPKNIPRSTWIGWRCATCGSAPLGAEPMWASFFMCPGGPVGFVARNRNGFECRSCCRGLAWPPKKHNLHRVDICWYVTMSRSDYQKQKRQQKQTEHQLLILLAMKGMAILLARHSNGNGWGQFRGHCSWRQRVAWPSSYAVEDCAGSSTQRFELDTVVYIYCIYYIYSWIILLQETKQSTLKWLVDAGRLRSRNLPQAIAVAACSLRLSSNVPKSIAQFRIYGRALSRDELGVGFWPCALRNFQKSGRTHAKKDESTVDIIDTVVIG